MWQDIVVGAIVALAVGYALWYWMPGALRRRLGAVRPGLAKAPSCGACSDCGGCAAPASSPDASAQGVPQRKPVWMTPQR